MLIAEKKFGFNFVLLTNLVFGFFPISFIIGNAIVNINVVLFCLLGIFHLRSKIFEVKFNFPIKIIFLFFCVILFSTSLSFIKSLYFGTYEYENLIRLIKSIVFFRFFLMLLIVYLLCKFDILNLKYFFLSSAFSVILVSLDIIFQHFFGFNIVGLNKPSALHSSGFFGEEYIAGGFIQNFSFFSLLFVAFIFKNKNYIKFSLTTITICILGLGILFSGNRMPMILFVFGLILVFLLKNELRKIILTGLIVLFILFKFIFSYNEAIKYNYISLHGNTIGQAISIKNKLFNKNEIEAESKISSEKIQKLEKLHFLSNSSHVRLLVTAFDIWSRNKIFGNGIKSFRTDCIKLFANNPEEYTISDYTGDNAGSIRGLVIAPFYTLYSFSDGSRTVDYVVQKRRLCSNHPHNYYLQILTETGIVGFLSISIIGFLFIFFVFKNFKFLKGSNIENFLILSCVISLFLAMFPLRTSGSLFSTQNITYIILISSILLSYKKINVFE